MQYTCCLEQGKERQEKSRRNSGIRMVDVRVERNSSTNSEHYLLEAKLETKMKTEQSKAITESLPKYVNLRSYNISCRTNKLEKNTNVKHMKNDTLERITNEPRRLEENI